MSDYIQTSVNNHIGYITLDRPKALNSLSLEMVRAITQTLLAWHDDANVHAVFIHSSAEKAFCAGGDIRFFYDVGTATPKGDSALLEDFFTEEYALNHLIHFYPKPYIALMNGVVMGGGMGIAQAGEDCRLRIVTERTKMAMPEVNIGLFPDVGGGYFLSRAPGQIGTYLGLTGDIINAADALYAGLADVFIPTTELPALMALLATTTSGDIRHAIREFAAPFAEQANTTSSRLATHRALIDQHFTSNDAKAIAASLAGDASEFTQQAAAVMQKRSPLLMSVTLEQLRRGSTMSVADCLRMERTMVRHCFKHGEVLEGVRALVVDKDNTPQWSPATLAEVSAEMVSSFFAEVWPAHAHPLRHLA
ncbi:enoyl-CoA hydratase/isomerase family protein [Undibacterium sp. RTI2.1]|uniref:enoyl-CoA hydratase/isomerase family protein n=1 Tax=unclassified Undibacterium TaxID=2630295 RepID=UPI002AB40B35|nr:MULTISPECIES: enoyl-CoA hydratase/isomerase family protein [unclassified Undibacterium]MDY7539205.1 enoyl-CoA hydratase/isomerase family protein [Undibacterium sp. 5I1]MEB0031056.1 enoyl-CoA hydratase/isomerase family protein [Undibacterium sp. RTI2.1]MEB0116257.1 enoyl-CoA hydratase/isomerase family protein [Undibacterium sp. RTI2.2]MEB0231124.1 enoyl-CoA hydratase/isomerase family protein [Undibacterium sp. 10I3]MEB0256997.1 enoyl-CoA hydratase/isomerase family protein [Undibacterium sp. 